jgi:hypothetical protein
MGRGHEVSVLPEVRRRRQYGQYMRHPERLTVETGRGCALTMLMTLALWILVMAAVLWVGRI